jgi:hypothetical protein
MTIHALVLEETPVKLWGLSSTERLRRQLKEAGAATLLDSPSELPASGRVLLLDGRFLFEVRTLSGLMKRSNSLLRYPGDDSIAAAIVDVADVESVRDFLAGKRERAPKYLDSIREIGTGKPLVR